MKRLLLYAAILLAILASVQAASAVTVVLKQGVNGYTGCTDTYMDSQNPTQNYGSLSYMHLYMSNHAPRRSILIRFDLTGIIPPGATLRSATLSLYLYQVVDMTSGDWLMVGPYRIRNYRDWVETQATWDCFKASTYWSTAGCENTSWDRYGTYDSYLYFYSTSQVNTYYHWNVTASVQAWLEGAQNNGWLLRTIDHDGGTDGVSFDSKESSVSSRPYLTIVYDEPIGAEETTWGAIKSLYR